MIKYIKMKKQEIALKRILYGYILDFVRDKEAILTATSTIVSELAKTPAEDLQEQFINAIAKLAHEQNQNDTTI